MCLYPDELSRALEDGINTAFAGKLTQNASVDTTYTQVGVVVLVVCCSPCGGVDCMSTKTSMRRLAIAAGISTFP